MERLIENITQLSAIPEEDLKNVYTFFRKEIISKGQFVLQGGDVSKRIYWVSSGCLKVYYLNEDKENVLDFFVEQDWFVELYSFINKTASPYYIQAIEDCEIYSISKDNFEKLREDNLHWEKFYSSLLEQQIPRLINKINDKLSLSNDDRYLQMMEHKPELINRIPQYLLASYLGLTPEGLSKLRRRVLNK